MMNPSRRDGSNNSSQGFVYFNTNNSSNQNSLDTSDFLSFSSESSPGTSPQNKDFRPSNFSSPSNNHFYGKTHKNRVGRNHYFVPHKGYGANQWQIRGHTYSNDNEQDNTSNHSHLHVYHRNRHQKNFSTNKHSNCSVFYDPSCLVDPWQELEVKFAQEKQVVNNVDSDISSQSVDENVENKPQSSPDMISDETDNGSDEAEGSLS